MADDTVGDGDVRPSHGVIYLDNQASTRPDPRVVEAMAPWLDVAANPHATEHATGRAAAAAVEQARERVANLLRCEPAEITFTSGATEASNIVLRGLLHSTMLEKSEEHTSELQSLMRISYAVLCLKKKTQQRCIDPTRNNHKSN